MLINTNQMEIIERLIDDLNPAPYNPRTMTGKQNQQLATSLITFGFVDPIIVNKHPDRMDVVVGGHQRCRKWQELGHDTVPTVEVNLDLEKEMELNIRLNHGGDWDFDMLANHFDQGDLMDWGFKATDFGINIDKIKDKEPHYKHLSECPECGHKW